MFESTIDMFFIYHMNIFALFFVILFYRLDKLLVGLPLFFGYCIIGLALYFLNNSIQSYVKIFSVLYIFGVGLIFVICAFLSIKRFKSGYKIIDAQYLIFGFGFGFCIFIASALLTVVLFHVEASHFIYRYSDFMYFLVWQSLFLGLCLLYCLAQSVYKLWGKTKGYSQRKVYSMVFMVGAIALVLNFLPYVVKFLKKVGIYSYFV